MSNVIFEALELLVVFVGKLLLLLSFSGSCVCVTLFVSVVALVLLFPLVNPRLVRLVMLLEIFMVALLVLSDSDGDDLRPLPCPPIVLFSLDLASWLSCFSKK